MGTIESMEVDNWIIEIEMMIVILEYRDDEKIC